MAQTFVIAEQKMQDAGLNLMAAGISTCILLGALAALFLQGMTDHQLVRSGAASWPATATLAPTLGRLLTA